MREPSTKTRTDSLTMLAVYCIRPESVLTLKMPSSQPAQFSLLVPPSSELVVNVLGLNAPAADFRCLISLLSLTPAWSYIVVQACVVSLDQCLFPVKQNGTPTPSHAPGAVSP